MTPGDKQKKIATAFARYYYYQDLQDENKSYEYWLLTEEGKRLTAPDDEVAELRAWKESMITLWEPVISYAQNNYLPGLHPGQSISEYVLKRLTAEEPQAAAEHEDSTIDVLTEIARSLVQMSEHQLDIKKQLDRIEGNMKWVPKE